MNNIKLRPWQQEAHSKALNWWADESNNKNFIINAAPGSGKTLCSAFIAKTLLERTNAKLSFSNGSAKEIENSKNVTQIGAIVEIVWLRSDIEAQNNFLGENENLQVF